MYTPAFKPGRLVSHSWLHTPECKVFHEIQELMVEHGMRHACVAAVNFDCLHELMTSNMETGRPAEASTPDRWRSVAVRNQVVLGCSTCLYTELPYLVDELLLMH